MGEIGERRYKYLETEMKKKFTERVKKKAETSVEINIELKE